MSEARSYLNNKIMNKNKSKAKAQNIIGWSMIVFYGIGFICVASGELDKYYIALLIVLIMPGAYLVWCAYQNNTYIKKAKEYNRIFANDKDGVITATELGRIVGKEYYDIFVELEKIFRRGYFQNCTLQQGRNPRVIINNAQIGDDKGVGFMQMKCPNCGGSTRIRANSRGVCEFCGLEIKAPKSDK